MLSAIKITRNFNGIARVSYAIVLSARPNASLDPVQKRAISTTSSSMSLLDINSSSNIDDTRSRSSKLRLLQTLNETPALGSAFRRLMSSKPGGRENCAPDERPRCTEKNLEKTGCMEKKRKEKENPASVSPFKSMWYNPECCKEECPDVFPRFDELYYVISDKAKRKYQQTWINCPSPRIVPKAICCFDQLEMPPFEKRSPKKKPKTACEPEPTCPPKTKGDCPRFVLKGCRKVRNPPNCFVIRTKTDCKKVCAPYPAFSECTKPKPKPRRPVECECLRNISMCEVWEYVRKAEAGKRKKS